MLMHRMLIGEAEAGLTVKFIENHTKQKNSDALTEWHCQVGSFYMKPQFFSIFQWTISNEKGVFAPEATNFQTFKVEEEECKP